MDAVTLSSKYQVVIPRRVRDRMGLRAGEKLQVIGFDDRIELIPLRSTQEMRGFLKGLDPSFERERDNSRRSSDSLIVDRHRHRLSFSICRFPRTSDDDDDEGRTQRAGQAASSRLAATTEAPARAIDSVDWRTVRQDGGRRAHALFPPSSSLPSRAER